MLGRVAAGVPIGAEIGLERQLWLDRALFSLRPDYALQLQGDSMIDDGILDGELVDVHRSNEARRWADHGGAGGWRYHHQRLERGAERIRLLPRNRSKVCTAA